jgi:CDP-alcohol phosphatidyltransferase
VIIGREIAVLGLEAAAAGHGVVVSPSIWGKLKLNVQFVALFPAIIRYDQKVGNMFLDEWAMTAAVVVTVLSAWSYLKIPAFRVPCGLAMTGTAASPVLVTGGSGFIGGAILEALVAPGERSCHCLLLPLHLGYSRADRCN